MVTRRDFLRSTIPLAGVMCGFWGEAFGEEAPPSKRPPNIVLLYADDLGWTDLGCYGSGYYETPNIDRLCADGLKFTSAYSAAANCAPARSCMLTGRYVPRHGVYTVGDKKRFDSSPKLLKWNQRKLLAPDNASGIAAADLTFAEELTRGGYVCGHVGKWHVGTGDGQRAKDQGFAETVPMGSAKTHWRTEAGKPARKPEQREHYLSDQLADGAVRFIRENQERPFMLYFADYLVHVPLEAKEELIRKYRNKPAVGGHRNPVYASMVESLDHSFGRVLGELDRLGLSDNTVVIFYSDNGGCGSARKRGLDHAGGITSNHPLRGMKGMLYEGGIRVPMVVRWPGKVKAGTQCDEPVIGVDIFPTLLELGGVEPTPMNQLDGESLAPLFLDPGETLDRKAIYWFMPGYLPGRQAPANAMRSGRWKLIENFEDGAVELYDLETDIGETENVADVHPDVVAALHADMRAWRSAVGAAIPERNPEFDPANEGKW